MLEDYAKFVDTTTSEESKDDVAFHKRIMEIDRDASWPRLLTAVIGMQSESGEFAEIVKKCVFQGKTFNEDVRFHLKRELGDILWYWIQGCAALDYTPTEVIEENIKRLEARYPNGFEVAKSENRKAGDL